MGLHSDVLPPYPQPCAGQPEVDGSGAHSAGRDKPEDPLAVVGVMLWTQLHTFSKTTPQIGRITYGLSLKSIFRYTATQREKERLLLAPGPGAAAEGRPHPGPAVAAAPGPAAVDRPAAATTVGQAAAAGPAAAATALGASPAAAAVPTAVVAGPAPVGGGRKCCSKTSGREATTSPRDRVDERPALSGTSHCPSRG